MLNKMLAPAIGAFLALAIGGSADVALADGYTPRGKVAYAEGQRCSGGPFEGPYIGASLGFGSGRTVQSSVGEPDVHNSDYAFIPGGQVGYNRQCGQLVFGVEADFNHAGFETNSVWVDPTTTIHLRDEVNWFGTVRGKVGVVISPNAMIYATGGWAYANTSHALSDPSIAFRQTDDDFKTGWVAGLGIELVHYDRWLVRGEALYVDLGDNSHTYTTTGCGGVCTGHAKWDDSFLVARLGLSYKFSREPVVPLK
jgi:outer membrane immunogenic protein